MLTQQLRAATAKGARAFSAAPAPSLLDKLMGDYSTQNALNEEFPGCVSGVAARVDWRLLAGGTPRGPPTALLKESCPARTSPVATCAAAADAVTSVHATTGSHSPCPAGPVAADRPARWRPRHTRHAPEPRTEAAAATPTHQPCRRLSTLARPFPPTCSVPAVAGKPTVAPVKVTTLANGLKVASQDAGGATASLAVHLKAGSRYEAVPGTAAVLEQMAFKSSAARSTAKTARDVEDIGATVSAKAGREVLVYSGAWRRLRRAAWGRRGGRGSGGGGCLGAALRNWRAAAEPTVPPAHADSTTLVPSHFGTPAQARCCATARRSWRRCWRRRWWRPS
jgi:hypothetical protein